MKKTFHFLLEHFQNYAQIIHKSLGEKNYILILSILVGIVSGLAAVLLKTFTEECHKLSGMMISSQPWFLWVAPAIPAIGIFFCILFVKFWVRGRYEKSLAGVISATANGTSDLPKQKTYSHIITSGITVGMGGSAGLEAPIALTGSAIGSNLAKLFQLGRESRTLLLACGGAAGISAVFNSPVAGALFACEILLPEFSIPALIPLFISSASAAVVSEILYKNHTFETIVTTWSMQNIPYYILLGVLAGLLASFMIKTSLKMSKYAEFFKNVWIRGLAGCLILYLAFLIFPMLKGEGYTHITALVNNNDQEILTGSPLQFILQYPWLFVALIGVLILLKTLISATTLECGGDGGIFAPSMFTGAFLGFFVARTLNLAVLTTPQNQLSEMNFIAVGMGGVLAGVMHAPLTGIFLIAEITGGYKLFIPLMIVSSLSCFICKKLCRYNVYKSVIAMRGGIPEPNQDAVAMEQLTVKELLETNFLPVKQDDTLRSLLQVVMTSKRNIFPVLDHEEKVVGLVTLDNIRPFLLDNQLYDVALVFDVMGGTGPILEASDSLGDATKLFENCHAWNLPVVDASGKYLGFVSKSGVFDRYRNLLKNKPDLF